MISFIHALLLEAALALRESKGLYCAMIFTHVQSSPPYREEFPFQAV
jgi:hypothetical protein